MVGDILITGRHIKSVILSPGGFFMGRHFNVTPGHTGGDAFTRRPAARAYGRAVGPIQTGLSVTDCTRSLTTVQCFTSCC